MPDFNLPLDIFKPPLEILVDAINQENRTAFVVADLSFTEPTPHTLFNSDINTAITLTPRTGSQYFSSVTIYYKRMDIELICESSQIEINTLDRTLLSELIPEINTYYGINLSTDDYYEQTLPLVDPLNPNAKRVVVLQITPNSVLFNGSATIVLDEARTIIDQDRVERKYFILVESFDKTVYDNKLVCINSDFVEFTPFQTLKNAGANVRRFRADKMLQLSDGEIHLRGEFDFTADLGIGSRDYTVKNIIIGKNGMCVEAVNEDIFGPDTVTEWYSHWNGDKQYIIDNADSIGTATNKVYRYNLDGQLLPWTAVDLTYVPVHLAVDKNGKLYTVSDVYTDTVKKIRIDRFLEDGTLDTTFSTVTIGITGSQTPLPVVDIRANDSGGLYIVLLANDGVNSLGYVPVVNDVPIIGGLETQIYAFNPVLKFTDNGLLDTWFNIRLKNNEPNSIYNPKDSNLAVGDNVLAPRLTGVTFFTNIANPITGYVHRTPISFNNYGEQVRITGNAYASQIRWVDAKNIHCQSNGKYLIYGQAMLRLPQGGWGEPIYIVAIYLESSELDTIIYTPPVVAGTPLAIQGLGILQLDY